MVEEILKKQERTRKLMLLLVTIIFTCIVPISIKLLSLTSAINYIIAPIIVIITLLVCFYTFVITSAKHFDWPFVICKENRAKLIAGMGGAIKNLVYNSKEFVVKEDWDVISKEELISDIELLSSVSFSRIFDWMLSLVGLNDIKWIGLFNHVHKYSFQWQTVETDKDGEIVLESHKAGGDDGKTPWVYLMKVPFGFEMNNIESKNMGKQDEAEATVPLKFTLMIVFRIINPYKAIIGVKEWLKVSISTVKEDLIRYVAQHTFDEIAKKGMSVKSLNGYAGDSLSENLARYGVSLEDLQLKKLDFADQEDAKKYRAKWQKEKEKEALIVSAEGVKQEAILLAEGRNADREMIINQIERNSVIGEIVKLQEMKEFKEGNLIVLGGSGDTGNAVNIAALNEQRKINKKLGSKEKYFSTNSMKEEEKNDDDRNEDNN